jgi:hypothetical protein
MGISKSEQQAADQSYNSLVQTENRAISIFCQEISMFLRKLETSQMLTLARSLKSLMKDCCQSYETILRI